MNDIELQAIKIEVGQRYLFVIQAPGDILKTIRPEAIEDAKRQLDNWLESDELTFILTVPDMFQVRLEKVDR